MTSGDTIVAISSAAGPAARMIVRASGPDAANIASQIWTGELPPASSASRAALRFNGLTVPGFLYVFRGPRSYTGEDLVEFHIPGNPLLARMLVDELISRGSRSADPGEFTARAYFNGRLDLTEAEGVAATISASNEQELNAARQLLAGELARRLRPAIDLIAETLALVEAGIDFSEEGVGVLSPAQLRERITRADDMLAQLLENSSRFERLSHEPRVVLVGRPNAGKSTLLNALAGYERAVTSPVAGTTRDVLMAEVALPRGLVHLTDVAGVESESPATEIESHMRRHALRAVETADVVVLVRDQADIQADFEFVRIADLIVHTKSDLSPPDRLPAEILSVSAKTGANLTHLRDELDRVVFGETVGSGASLALNARHIRAILDARTALARSLERVAEDAAELVALEQRDALDHLGGVVGSVSPDDVLGLIFSSFCIGK
jgi:tRNA modification GTPase